MKVQIKQMEVNNNCKGEINDTNNRKKKHRKINKPKFEDQQNWQNIRQTDQEIERGFKLLKSGLKERIYHQYYRNFL